jgi:hypothetical protein
MQTLKKKPDPDPALYKFCTNFLHQDIFAERLIYERESEHMFVHFNLFKILFYTEKLLLCQF